MAEDSYVYPGTDVLRNTFDIRDSARLSVVEANLTAVQLARLSRHHLTGQYDVKHLQAFHREIFASVYPWAGEIRTVAIAKAQLFAMPQHIRPYLGEQLGRLADEDYLRGLSRARFVEWLTHYLAELNAVHPFREGNGRTQRAFLGQLADEAGWEVAWSRLNAKANVEASIASLDGDNAQLHALVDQLVERRSSPR